MLSMARREQDKSNTAKKRALESPSESMARHDQDKSNTAKKRAVEIPSKSMARHEQDRVNTAKRRALSVAIDNAISNFLLKARMGPDFVCTVCHCIMYKQNVVPCIKFKYAKASHELLEQVFCIEYSYTSVDSKQWICKTCDNTLSRGNMPIQAKANHLEVDPVPE